MGSGQLYRDTGQPGVGTPQVAERRVRTLGWDMVGWGAVIGSHRPYKPGPHSSRDWIKCFVEGPHVSHQRGSDVTYPLGMYLLVFTDLGKKDSGPLQW